MRFKYFSSPFLGFLQATGLFVYIILIALLLSNADKIFGPMGGILGPMAFLLLFIISAIISGSLVLLRTGFLFWERRYKESFTLLGWITIWAIFYLASIFIFIFSSK